MGIRSAVSVSVPDCPIETRRHWIRAPLVTDALGNTDSHSSCIDMGKQPNHRNTRSEAYASIQVSNGNWIHVARVRINSMEQGSRSVIR